MDFNIQNGVWKLKNILHKLNRIHFQNLCLGELCFQFEFLFYFDFQMHKTHF